MAETLPEWLVDARRAVDRAGDEKQFQDRMDQLVVVEDELQQRIDRLNDLIRAAEAGRGTWWAPGDLVGAKVFTELNSVSKSVEQQRLWSRARNVLDGVLERARAEIREQWARHVTALAGNATELRKLVRVLGTAPALANEASKLDGVLGELTKARGELPDAVLMARVHSAANLLDELAGKLPPAVSGFVTEAARSGASLGLLTEEVREWLAANSVEGQFRIIVATKG